MPPPADARAGRIAFTHPDFVLFQVARFLIVAAVEMQAVAVGWQVYDLTKRALDLGQSTELGQGEVMVGQFVEQEAGAEQ